jgi:hypothetical protein
MREPDSTPIWKTAVIFLTGLAAAAVFLYYFRLGPSLLRIGAALALMYADMWGMSRLLRVPFPFLRFR